MVQLMSPPSKKKEKYVFFFSAEAESRDSARLVVKKKNIFFDPCRMTLLNKKNFFDRQEVNRNGGSPLWHIMQQ